MPEVAPSTWKTVTEFTWVREHEDGTIEHEYDPETGQFHDWGKKDASKKLKRVGWLPMCPDLARKIAAIGEIGKATHAPSILIDIRPDEDEKLAIYKECAIIKGYSIECKACKTVFRSMVFQNVCPRCGIKTSWKCEKCNKIIENEQCPDCNSGGRLIDPFIKTPQMWDEVLYHLGIEHLFLIKFNSHSLIVEH